MGGVEPVRREKSMHCKHPRFNPFKAFSFRHKNSCSSTESFPLENQVLHARNDNKHIFSRRGPSPRQVAENNGEAKSRWQKERKQQKELKRITSTRCFTTDRRSLSLSHTTHSTIKNHITFHLLYYYKLATIYSFILFPIASHNVFICFHSSILSFLFLPF